MVNPGKELKETVNKSKESAPSKQGRAVAVWGLGSRLVLGASRGASALSSRGISARPSPTSPAPLPVLGHSPALPFIPRPESPDSIPALLTHLRPLSPLVRRRPWCVGRKPRGSFLAEHGGPAASPPRPGLLLSSRLWLHVRRGGVGRWPSAQETDRGGHRARQLLRGSKLPSSRERLPPSSGDLKMAAAQRSANQRAGSGC